MTDADTLPDGTSEAGKALSPPEAAPSAEVPMDGGAGTGPASAIPPLPDDKDLLRLRELLFSREIALLDNINETLNSPRHMTQNVSDVLAEAVHMRAAKDPNLSMALEPVVDTIVKKSFHTRQNDFVNALFPLMGPTIRKSIAESFRSMLGTFSKSMEMAFSWKGLRWRFEAFRSGRPFSEIVMLNTLVYRVEQLFFIHSDTGLVLSQLTNESAISQDADMVSAMLTAIQDFARDCFTGGKDEALESLQMGEFTIYLEKGHRAYLACVVRGTPPADFRAQLRATLELMLVEYADALDTFNGDTAPFSSAPGYLETLMLAHYADEDKPLPLWAKALPVLLVVTLVSGFGYLYYSKEQAAAEQRALREQAAAEQHAFMASMRHAVRLIRTEPGLMVTNVSEAPQAPWDILAFKDALARAPEIILRENGVDPLLFTVRTVPFISYDPSIVMRRVRNAIKPPDTVTMTFDEKKGTLALTGTAPMSWIVSTREDARAIPGVEHVDVSGLTDPRAQRISAMVAEVENTVIEFPFGKDTPLGPELAKLKKAVDTLVELEKITRQMGFSSTLTIYGHADTVGNERRNYEISQSRARTVAAMLYARGSSIPVAIYGMGSKYPRHGQDEAKEPTDKSGDQADRRIELRVHFSLLPSAQSEMFGR